MLLSHEKNKFSGNGEDGVLLPIALYCSSFYFKPEFLSKLPSNNSLLLTVVSATSQQRLTIKNKPKIPQPKLKPKQKKAKYKTHPSKPISKDLTECEADV